jgi:hypothetical protein
MWPPKPSGNLPPIPTLPALKTSSEMGDTLLGIAHALALVALCGVGVFTIPIIYLGERKHFPAYARALVLAYIPALIAPWALIWSVQQLLRT